MLGESNTDIFLQRLPEIARRPLPDDDVCVRPGLLLAFGRPHFAVQLKREKIRSRELGIVGIFFPPRLQRFVCERNGGDQMRVRRVRAGANGVVVKCVVDSEIAHFHAAEVFVARRGFLEHLEYVLLPLGKLRSLLTRAALLRIALLRLARRGRSRNRTGESERNRSRGNRRERAFQRQPFLWRKRNPITERKRSSRPRGSVTSGLPQSDLRLEQRFGLQSVRGTAITIEQPLQGPLCVVAAAIGVHARIQ